MIVYEVATGRPLKCEPVDARELIASGFYIDNQEEVGQREDKPKRGRPSKAEEE